MPSRYRLADEEEAEDEYILSRHFDNFSIEPARGAPRANLQRRRRVLMFVMAGAAGAAVIALIVLLSLRSALGRTESYWNCPGEAMPARTPGTINFFVVGDWGRQGISEQKKVAKMMSTIADCMPPAFIISTGDNFYSHGLTSPSDWQVKKSFSDVYSSDQLQVPWYAVLGNHDYGDGIDPYNDKCGSNTLSSCPEGCCYSAYWQHTGRMNDARWHLQNGSYAVPTGAPGLLDIFMIDTNPMIPRYKDTSWYNNAGGIWEQNPETTKSQLRGYLAKSQAQWKLVVGHHPISSFGSHCGFGMQNDCADMLWLEPELHDAGVATYLSGHDHDLQHNVKLSYPDDDNSDPVWPHYVVSGAGSETRKNEKKYYKAKSGYSMEFMTDDSGFVAAQANATHLVMYFYGDSRSGPSHTMVLKAPVRAQPVPDTSVKPRSGLAVDGQTQAIQQVPAAMAAKAATAATAATTATNATAQTAATAATAATTAPVATAPVAAKAVKAAVAAKPATATATTARPAAVQPVAVQQQVQAVAAVQAKAVSVQQPATQAAQAAATAKAAAQPVQQPAAGAQAAAASLPRPLVQAAQQPMAAVQPVAAQPAAKAAVQPAAAAAVTTEAAVRPAQAAVAVQPATAVQTQAKPVVAAVVG